MYYLISFVYICLFTSGKSESRPTPQFTCNVSSFHLAHAVATLRVLGTLVSALRWIIRKAECINLTSINCKLFLILFCMSLPFLHVSFVVSVFLPLSHSEIATSSRCYRINQQYVSTIITKHWISLYLLSKCIFIVNILFIHW